MFERMRLGLLAVTIGLLGVTCTPGFNPDYDDDDVSAEVWVDPAVIDFGFVSVNSSPVERFELFNATAGTIQLRGITLTAGEADFQLVSPPDADYPIHPGEDYTINVAYYPLTEGDANGTVIIETNHADYPELEVSLLGCSDPAGCAGGDDDDDATGDDDDDTGDDDDDDDTGGECGTLELDPTSVNFPTTDIGQTSLETVTISNTGGDSLEVTSVTASGADFGYQGITPPTTIIAGGSLQFSAKFTPQSDGTLSGTLTVDSCDGSEEISLQGEGDEGCGGNCLPDIEVSPLNIDFGTMVGGTGIASFSISNTGIDPLLVTSVQGTTSAAGGTVDIVAGNTNVTIVPGDEIFYSVEWTPGELFPGQGCLDGLGSGQNYITITSDDPDEATVLIGLDGCCDAATGGTFCTYGDLITLLMCMDTAPCADPIGALLYCTLGFPC
jgi:hypothetical protein